MEEDGNREILVESSRCWDHHNSHFFLLVNISICQILMLQIYSLWINKKGKTQNDIFWRISLFTFLILTQIHQAQKRATAGYAVDIDWEHETRLSGSVSMPQLAVINRLAA